MDPKEMAADVPQERTKLPAPLSSGDASNNGANSPFEHGRIEHCAPADGLRVTLEEYWERWYECPHPDIDVSYEWNNGVLEAKPLPNHPQTKQYRWFFGLLDCYLEVNPVAKILCLETGAYMSAPDENLPSGEWEVVFKPDIGVILDDNPASWGEEEQRSYIGVWDMIVEELSDSTTAEVRRDTVEKKEGYARAGVKEQFRLDPKDRYMHFYRLQADGNYEEIEPDGEGVIRSQVLPGLQFRREDLLREPPRAELARDEVYAAYVIPDLQIAETRAEKAEGRADAEAAARRAAEEELDVLKAEMARLRQQRS